MFRPFLIVFLFFTTIGGFASGFAHLRHHGGWGFHDREAFERHVADICADAALKANVAKPLPSGN
jgi:hypothetical protein